jgi:hypothetical protein
MDSKNNLDFSRFCIQTALAFTARYSIARKPKKKDYSVMHLFTQLMGYYAISFMKQVPTVVCIDITSAQASQESTAPIFR